MHLRDNNPVISYPNFLVFSNRIFRKHKKDLEIVAMVTVNTNMLGRWKPVAEELIRKL
jgi:hypothetical protein